MATYAFSQVDVFASSTQSGNPLAVVHDAVGLSDDVMQRFARWTNLSETVFLLPPTDSGADYRVRIFTPAMELPFAGHPTIGSCFAWLAAGGSAKRGDQIVQECKIGLVSLRRDDERLAFAAPPLQRTGPLPAENVHQIAAALNIDAAEIIAHQWVDNGPAWQAVRLADAERVLSIRPDFAALGDIKLGIVGAWQRDHDCQFEVRAFAPSGGINEDPVTGSLNAGLAQWLMAENVAPPHYVAAQGTVIGRHGRVYINRDDSGAIWVGGHSAAIITGSVQF